MIDLNNLTVGEMALIEELGGQPITALSDDAAPKMKPLAAIALVVKRRSGEPTFTWNAALALPMAEINSLLGLNDETPVEAPGIAIPVEQLELSDAEGEELPSE